MRWNRSFFVVCAVTIIFNSGSVPIGQHQKQMAEEVERLRQHGVTVRYLDDQTVELRQDWSGFRRVKSLRQGDEQAIRAWIQRDSIPFVEIDPALIDTSQYAGWYTYWTTVPVSNGYAMPPLAGDIDQTGQLEVYGIYKDTTSYDFQSHIYDVDPTNGRVRWRYSYVPRRGPAVQFSDVDRDGLQEILFRYGDTSYRYEQLDRWHLPTVPQPTFAKFQSAGAYFSYERMTDLDGDTLMDYVFIGSPPESVLYNYMTTVAEYDPAIGNFQKVWQRILSWRGGDGGVGGYDVGDYDNDGKMNILASGFEGEVWVLENTGDNQYTVSFKDSLPGFINLHAAQTSGDVDNDGKRELFVAATMSNGLWTVVYETDANDHYTPTLVMHFLAGGSLDEPVYFTKDVNNDGRVELIILGGGGLYVFTSDADDSYQILFFSRSLDGIGVNFFDFNTDGKLDCIVSRDSITKGSEMLVLYSDIYRATWTTNVVEQRQRDLPRQSTLSQNYPNPFNPLTEIGYDLAGRARIELTIYNVLGQKIETLVSGEYPPGRYTARWDAATYPSGVYLYRLMVNGRSFSKKMVLTK